VTGCRLSKVVLGALANDPGRSVIAVALLSAVSSLLVDVYLY
jgi:hypothetical protein